MGIVGCVLALMVAAQALDAFDGDPSGFARFSVSSAVPAEEVLGRPVVIAPASGHDGKFFFALALDPFLVGDWVGERLDDPVYRARRILYPLVAGFGGLLPPSVVLWSLIGVNVLVVGLGTWALAAIARDLSLSPWLGITFALNPGNLFELLIDGSAVLGFALLLCAVLAWARQMPMLSAILLLGAVMSRETMVIGVVGLVALEFVRTRTVNWRHLLVPVGGLAAWSAYAAIRLPEGPAEGVAVSRNLAAPFTGIARSIDRWTETGAVVDVAIFVAVAIAAGVILWTAATKPTAVGWSVVGFALLLFILDVPVVLRSFDLTRSVAPVLSVAPLMLLVNPAELAES